MPVRALALALVGLLAALVLQPCLTASEAAHDAAPAVALPDTGAPDLSCEPAPARRVTAPLRALPSLVARAFRSPPRPAQLSGGRASLPLLPPRPSPVDDGIRLLT